MREPLDLVGVNDAAPILGVSRQRVGQLVERPEFPRPIGRTQSGRVWLRSEVEEYGRTRNKRTGSAGHRKRSTDVQ